MNRNYYIGGVMVVLGAFGLWYVSLPSGVPDALCGEEGLTIEMGSFDIQAAVVSTEGQRRKGLSGRESLAGCGMLFVYPNMGEHGIWMKDMKFAIDVVWLSDSKEILYAVEGMHPSSYPQIYTATSSSRYIIELPHGTLQENNVKVGDFVSFNLKNSGL